MGGEREKIGEREDRREREGRERERENDLNDGSTIAQQLLMKMVAWLVGLDQVQLNSME